LADTDYLCISSTQYQQHCSISRHHGTNPLKKTLWIHTYIQQNQTYSHKWNAAVVGKVTKKVDATYTAIHATETIKSFHGERYNVMPYVKLKYRSLTHKLAKLHNAFWSTFLSAAKKYYNKI